MTIVGVKAATQEGGLWLPGGSHDADDWARVRRADGTVQDFHYAYPGGYTGIWDGQSLGVVLWDTKCDEAFGYRYPAPGSTVWIGNGASADGPFQSLAAGGSYSFSFAIGRKADVQAWL